MSWRIVVISNRCKLDYSMNYMVIRGEETKRVLLDEIAILILENNAVSMTGCLISAMIDKKIRIVLCDNQHNPQAEINPYYGAHNDVRKIKQQLSWKEEVKQEIWTSIVKEKILNQSKLLELLGHTKESEMLKSYISDIKEGDVSNREGHAAKVYFNSIFGMDFTRRDEDDVINAALNYGYSIILSAFNREVVSNGYITQLGLAHDNQFNHFNFSCDLMEPFRVFVDKMVVAKNYELFAKDEKHELAGILNLEVIIKDMRQTLLNAIKIYTKSVFDALCEENVQIIKYAEL